jgi:hypothetical protein
MLEYENRWCAADRRQAQAVEKPAGRSYGASGGTLVLAADQKNVLFVSQIGGSTGEPDA